MLSRPELRPKGNRPTSAIYLGNSPTIGGPSSSKLTPTSSSLYDTNVQTPPSLPDLPEPPSPESSPGSRGSGLPSPPATNSTGSGSTGDPGSIALRQRPLSLASDSSGSSHRTVSERSATRSRSASRSSYLRDEPFPDHEGGDYEDDNDDLDGDQTARLDRRHQTSEHNLALQRVKSLTQRNRMAIDKLSRLGSPSPSVAPSTTSSSRSRQTRASLPLDYGASGSETERESTSASSSSRRPVTPPSGNHHVTVSGTPSPYRRLRQASTPESPHKARLSAANSPHNSPTARRRKRASMASIQSYSDEEDEDDNQFSTATGRTDRIRDGTVRDIAKSALAAVASSRTPLTTRRRGALPQEFVENADHAETRSVVSRRSDDVREHNRHSMDPVTPYKAPTRSSTLRETGRTFQAASRRLDDTTAPAAEASGKRERRATMRGGSAESVLRSPGRTLLSEGLRAAGLTRREEAAAPVTTTSTDVFRDRERRAATPSRELAKRAATSMASYRSSNHQDDDDEQQLRPSANTRRQHRTTYSMAGESDLARTADIEPDRNVTRNSKHLQSDSTSKRQSQVAVASTEHLRLMLETLQAFEANISKLPLGVTHSKTSSATELLKHAQHVVHITERINALMRHGTNKALEEQIQAEVDVGESVAAEEMLDVWRLVGGEYREGLRASDDLVRALTSFLIDVGSTLRKLSPSCGEAEFNTPSPHVRSLSLEEEGVRQQAARSGTGSELSGRKSVDLESMSRRSHNREEALRKLGAGGTGRESSLGRAARASPAFAALRDRERTLHNTPSPASTSTKPLPSLSTQTPGNPVRRLFTPSQQRERELETKLEVGTRRSSALRPSDSQKTVQAPDVEPSPSPASRTMDRTRALPAIPTSDSPPSLSRLTPVSKTQSNGTSSSSAASASVQRSVSTRESNHERRKPSIASIVTIRGSQAPPNLTTPSTALTSVTPTTVSHSHDTPPLLRTESAKSGKSGITFSRPSTSALSGIQQQARDGHRKSSYSIGDGPQAEVEDPRAPSRGEFASRTFSKARTPPELQTNGRPRLSPRVSSTEYVSNTVRNPATPFSKGSTSHAADRHAASTMLPHRTNSTRERRRTVTDIFPQE